MSKLLLETEDKILLESGDFIILDIPATTPFIKRRVSFLSKAQSITLEISNNELNETFTIAQFAVTGSKEDKKTFSPLGIVSMK